MRNEQYERMNKYFGLDGKVAIVTGAGNGIGEGIAKMLSGFGAKVAVCDIEVESAERVAQEIRDDGGEAIAVACDVREETSINAAVLSVAEKYGTINILVNNAGGGGHGKTLEDMSLSEWNRLMTLNLTSAYIFSMAVIPYMKKNMSGKIVNVSSGAGITGDFTDVHYVATKAGMIGMTKEMANELMKYHINVNALGTGLTDTRMSRASYWEEKENSIPWYRVGTPYDQAAAVTFLVSDAAEYVTGQTLCPNGGAWMNS